MSGINFGEGVPWLAINQIERRRIARDPDVKPRALRIMAAAEGWANRSGHAEFKRGELGEVLRDVDKNTGEMKPVDKYAVRDAIDAAVRMGLVDRASNARCLVLPSTSAQKAGLGGFGCRTHVVKGKC